MVDGRHGGLVRNGLLLDGLQLSVILVSGLYGLGTHAKVFIELIHMIHVEAAALLNESFLLLVVHVVISVEDVTLACRYEPLTYFIVALITKVKFCSCSLCIACTTHLDVSFAVLIV